MPRYIDADKVIARIKATPVLQNICLDGYFIRDYICDLLDEMSTAEVEALYNAGYRKQSEGEWIAHEDDWCGTYYTCSVCKCDWTTIDGTPQENNMRFCPECGAKMKGGAE